MSAVLKAQLLMFISTIFASFASTDISYLLNVKGVYHWTELLLSNAVVGSLMCVLYWLVQCCQTPPEGETRKPLFGSLENVPWLIGRGISGGGAMACAWVGMTYLNVAEANTLMFTIPAWTGLFAWLLLGQAWRWYEITFSVVAIGAVLLVIRPPFLFPSEDHGHVHTIAQRWIGASAALSFALLMTLTNLIIQARIGGKESANTVSLYAFLGTGIIDLPFLFTLNDKHAVFEYGFDSHYLYLFVGVGAFFYLFEFIRSWSFMISDDASVSNLIYLEITFVFLWQITILGVPCKWQSAVGAFLLCSGSFTVAFLTRRSARTVVEPASGNTSLQGLNTFLAGDSA
jgi:drug/metabolite transporter (DMT)-like permease